MTAPQTKGNNALLRYATGNPANIGGRLNTYTATTTPKDVTVHTSSLAGFVYIDSNNNGVKNVERAGEHR